MDRAATSPTARASYSDGACKTVGETCGEQGLVADEMRLWSSSSFRSFNRAWCCHRAGDMFLTSDEMRRCSSLSFDKFSHCCDWAQRCSRAGDACLTQDMMRRCSSSSFDKFFHYCNPAWRCSRVGDVCQTSDTMRRCSSLSFNTFFHCWVLSMTLSNADLAVFRRWALAINSSMFADMLPH